MKYLEVVDLQKVDAPPTKKGWYTSDEIYDAVDSGEVREGDVLQLENGDGHGKNVRVSFVKVPA